MWAPFPSQEPMIGEAFPTIMDAVATGCLFACLRSSLESKARYLRALRSPMIWTLLPFILLTNAVPFRTPPMTKAVLPAIMSLNSPSGPGER
jgi:hypothetical protein